MNKNIFFLYLNILLLSSLSGFNGFNSFAQTRVIYFADKANTTFSLQKPQEFLSQKAIDRRTKQGIKLINRDLPVNINYVNTLRQAGVNVRYTSKWFNACVAICDDNTWNTVKSLPFIKSGDKISAAIKNNDDVIDTQKQQASPLLPLLPNNLPDNLTNGRIEGDENYGTSLTQAKMVGIDAMHKANFTGKGMTIAVFDAGFPNVDINKDIVFPKMTILGTYNFINMQPDVYRLSSHGSTVLSVLASYKPNEIIGAAFEASYYLFITEIDDNGLDDRIEEFNWLAAAERADSLGVDIINSSLGYNYFKNSIYNYTQNQLNGKTSIISQAATMAASVGMLVVSSAGNIFEPEWTKIKMPADADSILTVGGVNFEGTWVSSSLVGNTTDGRVKPDVAVMGSNVVGISSGGFVTSLTGTSYAAPLAAGLAAGLWQANPTLSAIQLLQGIRRSGSIFFSPNTQIGYGIPNFSRAMNMLSVPKETINEEQLKFFPNPIHSKDGVLTLLFDEKYNNETYQITIFDKLGRKVFVNSLILNNKEIKIPLQNINLSAGLYIVSVESKEYKAVRKLMVY